MQPLSLPEPDQFAVGVCCLSTIFVVLRSFARKDPCRRSGAWDLVTRGRHFLPTTEPGCWTLVA